MAKRRRRIPRYLRDAKLPPEDLSGDREHRQRIVADLTQQAPNNSYGARLFYEDHPFVCIDCGQQQVWTAEQQQWWYEVAKGPIYSTAVRCRACRKSRKG